MINHKIQMLPLWITIMLVAIARLGNAQCNAAHNRIAAGGVCVCMPGYYDSGTPNCQLCSTPCLTCTSTATTCTSCNSALFLTLLGTTCVCMDGYVMILGVCQPCHYSCKTCSGLLSTNCITCDTSVRLFVPASNTCICLNTTYDDSTLQSCQPCNSKCLWCSASTSNDCTACDSNMLRAIGTSNPGPCICYTGYYDSTPALCPQCSYTCATCTITATTCVTCNSANFRSLSGTSCSCIAHYYQVNTAICSECSPRCGNCSTSASTCLTCNNTLRVLVGTNCPCIDGYYENSATITCLPCTNYCKTCENSSSTCLSCYSFGNRLLYNATCPCISGYYDNGTINCIQCQYQCLTCLGPSPAICLTCDSSAHRTLSVGACPCDDGYYESGSVVCQPCMYYCQTCSSSSNLCTSCDASLHRTLIATDCNCTIGYYDDGVHALCQPCHYSCLSCFAGTSSSCYTCQINRDYNSYSCPCMAGMYELSQICYICDISCATCTINATYCTSCPISRTLVNGTCVCSPGYYVVGLSCSPCSASCLTCSTTSTTCTSCDTSHGSYLSSSSCICMDGFYEDTTTLLCQPCHISCLTCLSELSTACLTCNSTNYRQLVISQCLCMAGYFDDSTVACISCHTHCTSCFGPTDYNCSGCISGYVLIGSYCRFNLTCLNYLYSGVCMNICPTGTYGVTSATGNICLPCINNCLTCSTPTYCLSCINGTSMDTTTHYCISGCLLGQYLNPTRGCLTCPNNCSACTYTSKVLCTECLPGYQIRDDGCCVSTCTGSYIDVAGRCHKCIGNCLTCTSLAFNGCLSCQAGSYLLSGVCYKICPLGYAPILTTCSPCPTYCQTCLDNTCLSCSAGYYLSLAFECVAVGFFRDSYNQIRECHPNCKSCTDTSFSSCLLCSQHRGDNSEFAVSGYCECKSGSIDTGDGKCDVSAYQALMQINEVLIGGTEAVLYMSLISSIVSSNYVPLIGFFNYLQAYSIFYYLNSSAVMQTDLILQSYQNVNILTYYRSSSWTQKRLLLETQNDESLFMRGRSWEYPIQWGLPAFLIICVIWVIALVLFCCCNKVNKVQNESNIPQGEQIRQQQSQKKCNLKQAKEAIGRYFSLIKQQYIQAVPIIFFLLTYLEIGLYSAISFKTLPNQMKNKQFQLSTVRLGLSILLCSYYVAYLIRLIIGCYRFDLEPLVHDQKPTKKPLGVLFHQFNIVSKSKLTKVFIPLQVMRNLIIAILMVFLSYSPNLQSFSCLITFGFYLLLNLCICPYKGAVRIYFHLCDLLLTIQAGLLTYITALPEISRIGPSQTLIALNFLQLLLVLIILSWVTVKLVMSKVCQKKAKSKKANKKQKQVLVNEQSLSNLADIRQIEIKQKQEIFYHQDAVLKPIQTSSFHPPSNMSGFRSEKITKKYRIKNKM